MSENFSNTLLYNDTSLNNLYTYLNINFNSMNWINRIELLWYINKGLYYLHDNNLVHLDFHPGNLLFNDDFLNIQSLVHVNQQNKILRKFIEFYLMLLLKFYMEKMEVCY